MNDIREIVTKAVIAKGKKTFNVTERITPAIKPYGVLGCWIINHEFDARKSGNSVEINGKFEVNIWFSQENNTRTEVERKTIHYRKSLTTKQIVTNYIENSDDILARIAQQPTCNNARINDGVIEIDISFEIIAEIIGETKMQVTVFNTAKEEAWEDDDLDIEVNEDFLQSK